jgi:DNA-binding MarR family transcriptional regulator
VSEAAGLPAPPATAGRNVPDMPEAGERRADHRCIPGDSVDRLLADWQRVRPDLDFAPVAIVSRLGRVRAHVDAALDDVFARHGLTAPGFAVLVTLARIGEPEGVSQRRLADELGLTSGTVSVRMDRLAEQGLIERRPDPEDRRNTRIVLTRQGREVFERIVPAHLANERRLLVALDDDERELLATLLRKLLVEYEGSRPSGGRPARLGLTVAPAHVAMQMRDAVGLDASPGLLVRRVANDGPAARAGLRPGDVLVRAGGRPLTSVAALYAALAEAAGGGTLRVAILRGAGECELVLTTTEPAAPAESAGRAGAGEHVI